MEVPMSKKEIIKEVRARVNWFCGMHKPKLAIKRMVDILCHQIIVRDKLIDRLVDTIVSNNQRIADLEKELMKG